MLALVCRLFSAFGFRQAGAKVAKFSRSLIADHGIVCSMSRSGNVWDNAAMESFFSSLKTDRTARKTYRTRDEAKPDVFDYIECFYNAKRRHSIIGYKSPMEFEMQAELA
jgi:putative transposase